MPSSALPAPVAHKFGGTSVANAERIRGVAKILLARSERQVVVVSAMSKVTDALIALVRKAAARDATWADDFEVLHTQHRSASSELLTGHAIRQIAKIDFDFESLRALLQAQSLVGAVSADLMDLISGFGEVWSSSLLDAYLQSQKAVSTWLDAREVLVVETGELGASVDWQTSRANLERWKQGQDARPRHRHRFHRARQNGAHHDPWPQRQ